MPMFALLLAAAASAQTPAALPQTPAAQTVAIVDKALSGPPTELAVLGTAHLSQLDKRFTSARLEPLLARLAQWRPTIITVEENTGRHCDEAAARPDVFGTKVSQYCSDVTAARAAAGVDQVRAEAAIDAMLAKSGEDRTPAERRRLATLFMAAGDFGSALVQWLRLAPPERRADDLLSPAVMARIVSNAASNNETYAIAATLAARLGLERVYPIDDATGGRIVLPYRQTYVDQLTALWNNPHGREAEALGKTKTEAMLNGGDILAFYRWMNDPATLAGKMRHDFAAAIADRSPEQTGRLYLAYWETRNLNMVANIRYAFGRHPGTRVLAIVGSSHKPYFERYLATQSDVRIVDVSKLLR
jgi:hypothetical protein